jgi:hypothetical protein
MNERLSSHITYVAAVLLKTKSRPLEL